MKQKITIFHAHFYREAQLPEDALVFSIGTLPGCDIRLRKELFFTPVVLYFEKRGNRWQVSCAEHLYLNVGDIRKVVSLSFNHGEHGSFALMERSCGSKLFHVLYDPDFEESVGYNRCIDIAGQEWIRMGSMKGCDIVFRGESAVQERLILAKIKDSYRVDSLTTRFGLLVNGIRESQGVFIRDGDYFSLGDNFFYYNQGALWTAAGTDMDIPELRYEDDPKHSNYPFFCRKTRMLPAFDGSPIEILDPGQLPVRQDGNLLLRVLPSLGMLAAAVVMAVRGSGTMLIFSGISASIGIFTAAAGLVRSGRKYRKELENRKFAYERYIAQKRREIGDKRELERRISQELYRPMETVISQLQQFSPDLFDRGMQDRDFLCIRLGKGRVPSGQQLCINRKERLEPGDELQGIPAELVKEFEFIEDQAVICDLKMANAVGISGNMASLQGFFRNLVIDLAARHDPNEVKMVFLGGEGCPPELYPLRLLPHASLPEGGLRAVAVDEEGETLLVSCLVKELSDREQTGAWEYQLILFLFLPYRTLGQPLLRFVKIANTIGVTFVFLAGKVQDIVRGCAYMVELHGEQEGVFLPAADCMHRIRFSFDPIDRQAFEEMIYLLAPVQIQQASREERPEKGKTLLEVLGAYEADDLDLEKWWTQQDVTVSMAAPIGASHTGTVCLDIHDSGMGPHGLIAGTTGSGKSELLQTYLLSLAVRFHPWDVQFVIIDFKGGGMASQLEGLPHLAGVITNIDGTEIERSLKAIKAELLKRQRLFEEAKVNHIDHYIRQYKENGQGQPLGHLLIIADEFAELKAQKPEFMKELISAARIGRSLGVHLILATQKPSGQVDEQIWSNSRFRICLKVQNAADSNEVLKSPLAAQIQEAGMAYLQVGNNEIFELFRAAYSSGPEHSEGEEDSYQICTVSTVGRRTAIYEKKQQRTDMGKEETQRQAIIRHIRAHCKSAGIQALPNIFLPMLSSEIPFPKAPADGKQTWRPGICDTSCLQDSGNPALWVRIGIYDDPGRQFQGEYRINLAVQNLMIIGASQSGKTNLLQTCAYSLLQEYSSEEVNIYVLDYASSALRKLEAFAHVGGVVCAGEEEKTRNLLRFLEEQVQARKGLFSSEGVGSYAEYIHGKRSIVLPRIVLLLDHLSALKELFLTDDSQLLELCSNGLSVGISIIIANPRITGIGYKYLADFAGRIALHCNEPGEYSYLFGKCRKILPELPGRCLVEMEKELYECQVYQAFSGELPVCAINRANPHAAIQIPMIPKVLHLQDIADMQKEKTGAQRDESKPYEIIVGVNYETVEPFTLDISEIGALAIVGRKGSGKHNWMKYTVAALLGNAHFDFARTVETKETEREERGNLQNMMVRIYAADGIRRRLAWVQNLRETENYTISPTQAATYAIRIRDVLKDRYETMLNTEGITLESEPLILWIIDSMDAIRCICEDADALAAYREIMGRYRSMKICLLIACMENSSLTYNAPEILKNLRDERQFLYFDDLKNLKVIEAPISAIRHFSRPMEPGDAYFIRNNDFIKLKTPWVGSGG